MKFSKNYMEENYPVVNRKVTERLGRVYTAEEVERDYQQTFDKRRKAELEALLRYRFKKIGNERSGNKPYHPIFNPMTAWGATGNIKIDPEDKEKTVSDQKWLPINRRRRYKPRINLRD